MSNKNNGKALTMDLVFTKTKSDSLQNIKNLNLWGNDLQDLHLIEKMPNLQVVSLSVNRIGSLKDFSKCTRLQELYLRKNNIVDIREIKHLMKLPSLKVLWLHDNPCAQIQNYREIVIKHLPNLMKLDNNPVTPQQRAAGQKINFSLAGYDQNDGDNKYQEKISEKIQQKDKYQQQNKWDQKWQNKGNLYEQKFSKPNNKNISYNQSNAPTQQISRNQNILMAILSLMRQLDNGSLEIVKRQAENMMNM